MFFFGIAFLPPGNILRELHALRTRAFRDGDADSFRALPEAFFIGFYGRRGETDAGRLPGGFPRELPGGFPGAAPRLFASLPETIRITECARHGGKWYCAPDSPFPAGRIADAADGIAAGCGLFPLDPPVSFPPCAYFISGSVTPEPLRSLSFKHLDAALYAIDSGGPGIAASRWALLSRVPRRTGPRKKQSAADA